MKKILFLFILLIGIIFSLYFRSSSNISFAKLDNLNTAYADNGEDFDPFGAAQADDYSVAVSQTIYTANGPCTQSGVIFGAHCYGIGNINCVSYQVVVQGQGPC